MPATYVRGRPRAVKAAASAVSASLTACLNLSVSCALLYNKRKETWVQSKNLKNIYFQIKNKIVFIHMITRSSTHVHTRVTKTPIHKAQRQFTRYSLHVT